MNAPKSWIDCPESVSGHDPGGTQDGTCAWCGQKINFLEPVAWEGNWELSDLRESYDYHHDPDFGALDRSQIRRRYETGRES
jgi:hypothetical protein